MISLGCAKNLVDSEILIGGLKQENYEIVNKSDDANILIVNTCGFLESAREVSALIERENGRGVPTDRIVLAGFSQGGAMALHVGRRYPEQLAGMMILSAYLVLEDTIEKEASGANAQTPSLFCHGTLDAMVPFKGGQHAFEHTALTNKHVVWQEYPMGHEVCIEEIEDIGAWLHELLSVA